MKKKEVREKKMKHNKNNFFLYSKSTAATVAPSSISF